MRTEALIALIAQDRAPRWRLGSLVALAAACGSLAAALVLVASVGVRPDIARAVESARFLFKFVPTIALAAIAIPALRDLGRPDIAAPSRLPLALPPALLLGAGAVELVVLPEPRWLPSLVGHNALYCLTLIPVLSAAPLACFIAALRQGAPTRPGLAGAIAGLAAAGIAATLYAAHCDDDSPLFVTLWYSLAALTVTAAGWVAGRRFLAW